MTIIPDELKPQQRALLRVMTTTNLLKEVEDFCQWRGVSKKHFVEHGLKYILAEDTDWQAHKNGNVPVSVESQ